MFLEQTKTTGSGVPHASGSRYAGEPSAASISRPEQIQVVTSVVGMSFDLAVSLIFTWDPCDEIGNLLNVASQNLS